MKTPHFAALIAALALVSLSAQAEMPAKPAPSVKFNGVSLNGPGIILQGRLFNGMRLNGPGLFLQARNFNGFRWNGLRLNGPGLILQGRMFNGFSATGIGYVGIDGHSDEPLPMSSDDCTAPLVNREWPLSALRASSVKVRLVAR